LPEEYIPIEIQILDIAATKIKVLSIKDRDRRKGIEINEQALKSKEFESL
jgi:hypothetical protein